MGARHNRGVPATRLGEIRRALFTQARHGFREQMAVAEPGQRVLQSGAVVMQRDAWKPVPCVSMSGVSCQ